MYLTGEKFKFQSSGLKADTFGVVRFHGEEGLSKLFEFEITLVSQDKEINLDAVMEHPAVLSILRTDENVTIDGVLKHFDVLHAIDDHVFYQATLVPQLWWLTLTHHNQIFLDQSIPEIISQVLKDGGLDPSGFELRLQNSYPPREYVSQYDESHYDFFARRLEHEGLYYFFEHGTGGSKLVITDTKLSHSESAGASSVRYLPPSGLEATYHDDVLSSFTCRRTTVPKAVQLKDYNYRKPDVDLSGEAKVSPKGPGQIYLYGENVKTPSEGKALAQVRSEEYKCREEMYYGSGTTSFLRPGYLFHLDHHFRESFNRKYLIIETKHTGSQAAFLTAGLKQALNEFETDLHYNIEFTAIPAEVQFRPARITKESHFYGTMNAKIDASGSGEYAELDELGRYKVILPFDLSGRSGGKASHFLRMMQPYAGADHGMHFPLHKNAEVLLTFIDGDPDRPIIAGAVPNPNNSSLVKNKNQTQALIQTGGQNKVVFEDKKDGQHVFLKSPTANTYVRLGSKNEEEHEDKHEEGGFVWHTEGKFIKEIGSEVSLNILGSKSEVTVGAIEEVTAGAFTEIVGGAYSEIIIGQLLEVVAGVIVEIKKGYCFEVGESTRLGVSKVEEMMGSDKVELKAGGPSPGIALGVANAIQLAITTTAGAKAAAATKDGSKIAPLAIFSSVAAVNSILTAAMMLFWAKSRIPNTFASTLEMDKNEAILKSPKVEIKASRGNIELKARDALETSSETAKIHTSGNMMIDSEKGMINIQANNQPIIINSDKKWTSILGKEAQISTQEKISLRTKTIDTQASQKMSIATNQFVWKPYSGAGTFTAGNLKIDGATGQVKIA